MNPENQKESDSLKISTYPYILPILGQKAVNAGYSLPYTAGLSINYFTQTSDIVLEDLQVGFNGGEKFDLSSLVQFDVAKARASALTFRPTGEMFYPNSFEKYPSERGFDINSFLYFLPFISNLSIP